MSNIDTVFAEVDIEPLQSRSAAMPASAPITPRAPDPLREKFYEMRRLGTKRPFPKNDSELFYRQAQFMEDFEDDYDGDAKFNMYYPYYQHMGYDYLRTYFTWRTKLRRGEIRPTSLSYIFLYIYELLSGIGVQNPSDGLTKLMDIWGAFAKDYSAIEIYLPKWLKDYHVFYETGHSFSGFVDKHNMQKYYSLTLMFDTPVEGQLERLNSLSGYDVTKSKFYNDENKEILTKCFDAVLDALQGFCAGRGGSFEDMLVYSVSKRMPWRPFKSALFGSMATQADREVHISKYERYCCKNGQWTANLPIYYSSQKEFIGYIIKKTEACLRTAVGYKYKLAVEMKPGIKSFRELQRTAASRAELDSVIEKAVIDFHRDINRVVVTVDRQNLARIREEALETQEQLIVEDGARPLPVADEGRATFSEREASTNEVKCEPAVKCGGAAACCAPEPPLTLSFADGWKALKKSLTDVERGALGIALAGGDIKTFADTEGVMLEVLIDGINEKASDCIGDSILELADEVYVFDEYKTNIAEMI